MINVSDLSFAYLEIPIFTETSFVVGANQKVAIVGPNGAGKSTLLKIIQGMQDITAGKIEVLGTIAYVPQEVKTDPIIEAAVTVKEYIDVDNVHGDHTIKKLLSNLEAENVPLDALPSKLSGGQKTKISLARALLMEPDILLLDEPTNFMDVQGKKWVMDFLANYPKTVLLISHDIELLDRSIDKVLYVNTHTKKVEEYKGNYTKFLKLRQEREDLLKRQVAVEQKHIDRMKKSLVRLMGNKSKKGVRQRVIMQRRIERNEEHLPELPPEVKSIHMQLPEPDWTSELVLKAEDISVSFGDKKILDKVSLTILRGQRIALIGPNGVGKSTLIKTIMGINTADEGTLRKSDSLNIGYYSQEFDTIDLSKTLYQVFEGVSGLNERQIRSVLAKFMFTDSKLIQRVETLSGGEKTRLSISQLLLAKHNLLILDEPTTYLDVLSQKIILEALKEYKGAMLIVSHTEDFIKELNPDKALLLPENRFSLWSEELLGKVAEY